MTPLVPISMFGWIPAVLGIFALLPPRRAVIAAFIVAWLFLPMSAYILPGLPNYTKMSATCMGVLLAVMIFDSARIAAFRPSLADLPILLWCLSPLGTSLSTGAGLYDGISSVVNQGIIWGVPYFIGRLYFNDWTGLRELAMGIFVGALIYVPLCLYEIRFSPQLHNLFYGFHAHSFMQTRRYGGFRPTVFMQHGLMVAMWMSAGTLIGFWLWHVGGVRRLFGAPLLPLVLVVAATAVLCKSAGPLVLLTGGLLVLWLTLRMRRYVLLWVCALAPIAYIAARAGLAWDGQPVLSIVESIDADRAASLRTRLINEEMLIENGRRQPLFGIGYNWGSVTAIDEWGRVVGREAIPDALWVILFARNGALTALAMPVTLLLPIWLWMLRIRAEHLHLPLTAAPFALAVLMMLYAFDNLMNAMTNPIFMLCCGGLTGLMAEMSPRAARASASRIPLALPGGSVR